MKHLLLIAFILPFIIGRLTQAQTVDSLIQSLADPDPSAREKAEKTLRDMSKEVNVRPALVQASRNGDPAVSSAAARVLLSLPWLKAGDPPELEPLLAIYGNVAEAGRSSLIHQMAQRGSGAAWPTLLRLLAEEPSEEVCWSIASHFHTRILPRTGVFPRTRMDANAALPATIVEMTRTQLVSPDRPSALVIAGRAWETTDPAKSTDFYRRAIEMESRNPTQDNGELDEVFDILVSSAVGARQYDEAARLVRVQCGRLGLSQNMVDPEPVFALFILHSRYGPLQGFAQDLKNYSDYTGSPEVLYALSRIYARCGRWIEAMAFRDAAQSATLTSPEHVMLSRWLAQLNWDDFARREALAALNTEDLDSLLFRGDALNRLFQLAADDENDALALDYLEKMVVLSGQDATPSGKAMMDYLKAKIARAKGDQAGFKTALDSAMTWNARNYDFVLKVYPLLKQAGRDEEAKRLFEDAYTIEEKNLHELGRDDAESLNNLAWLCARCDQHLSEAAEYAKHAMELDPDNAAYMDTLADVQFRLGNPSEAVALEKRALLYRPEDEFMHKQLQRFSAGSQKRQ